MDIEKTAEDMRALVERIARDRNPVTAPLQHDNILNLMRRRWNDVLQRDVEVDRFAHGPCERRSCIHHGCEHRSFIGKNLWAPHVESPQYAIWAHYDTIPGCPGADDNASGIAVVDAIWRQHADALLHVAFALTDFEEGDPCDVQIALEMDVDRVSEEGRRAWIAFLEEEFPKRSGNPFLGGDRMMHQMRRNGSLEQFEVVIDFETCGFTAPVQEIPEDFIGKVPVEQLPGNFVALLANAPALHSANRLADAYRAEGLPALVLTGVEDVFNARRSEHDLFWQIGLPAIQVTDSANFRNPNYHRPTDTAETLDYVFMAKIASGTANFLLA